jgi:DNA-directed RNA polymerase II subunit RPB2
MTSLTRKNLEQLGRKYFEENGLVEVQTRSYDFFTDTIIPETVRGADISVRLGSGKIKKVKFGDIYFDAPATPGPDSVPITPHMARLCNMSYDLTLYADIEESTYNGKNLVDKQTIRKRKIGCLPLMVRSSRCILSKCTHEERVNLQECHYDTGGYFIVKGKERAIISHERLKGNQVYVFKEKANSKKKWTYSAEIRSFSKTSWSLFNQIVIIDGNIGIFLPSFTFPIPIGILMRLCGASDDDIRTVINYPKGEKHINNTIREISNISKKSQSISAIAKLLPKSIPECDRKSTVKKVFFTEFLPHLGPSIKKKLIFTGHAIHKLLSHVYGDQTDNDDRDNFTNKRADTAGYMLGTLFRSVFKRFLKMLGDMMEKKESVEESLREIKFPITAAIKYSMSTGNWSAYKSTKARKGVSQILSRITYISMLSHLRRLVTPTGNEGKVSRLRQLHSSQWGMLCPFETPEGKQCGIVKNFSLSTIVSVDISPIGLIQVMELQDEFDSIEEKSITVNSIIGRCKIIVNDDLIGYTDDGEAFSQKIRLFRRQQMIDWQVSVAYDDIDNEAKFYTDNGRCMRPVMRVIDSKLIATLEDVEEKDWSELVTERYIEYIDSSETEWSKVVLYPEDIDEKTDYCEIDPFLILGICASIIPFSDHNPAPRNAFEASMIKQALGVYATNFIVRYDTTAHVLCYSQKSLSSTIAEKISGISELSPGYNAIVAVCVYGGHNQEDAMIMNQSAIERGMFHSIYFKSYECDEEMGGDYSRRTICIPELEFRSKSLYYGKLENNGIVKKGTYVEDDDVLIGRVSVTQKGSKDSSEHIKRGDGKGIVDSVFIGHNSEGVMIVKIRIGKLRIPEIGDKFASRQAQKGVLGKTYNQADMPWSMSSGIVPDIIINPAAFPSRMTIALPLECISSKAAAASGYIKDATPFRKIDHSSIADDLREAGLSPMGNEMMCNGFTGKPFRVAIFMGPVFYQKLKHMVVDKIHARARGPVQMLYRQPVEGRSRGGGLRVGEMEREAIVAHGGSALLHDRLYTNSDPFQVEKCPKCGMIISSSDGTCETCNQKAVKTHIPYACKTLFQKLGAVVIKVAID